MHSLWRTILDCLQGECDHASLPTGQAVEELLRREGLPHEEEILNRLISSDDFLLRYGTHLPALNSVSQAQRDRLYSAVVPGRNPSATIQICSVLPSLFGPVALAGRLLDDFNSGAADRISAAAEVYRFITQSLPGRAEFDELAEGRAAYIRRHADPCWQADWLASNGLAPPLTRFQRWLTHTRLALARAIPGLQANPNFQSVRFFVNAHVRAAERYDYLAGFSHEEQMLLCKLETAAEQHKAAAATTPTAAPAP